MKLMIVDDDDQIREGMAYGIQWDNFGIVKVICLKNGKEALQHLEEEYFDIVITDISMPVMSGVDLMREARSRYQDISFILISGYKEFEYAQAGIQYGAEGYILKPIHLNELVELVSKVIKKIEERKDIAENQSLVEELEKDQIMRQILRGEMTDNNRISGYLCEKGGFSARHLLLGAVVKDDCKLYRLETDSNVKGIIRNKMTEYLAGYTYMFFQLDGNEGFLLIDVVDSTLRVFHLKQQIERMLRSINREVINGSFSLGISLTGHIQEVKLMYRQGKSALEEWFFQGRASCISYEEYVQKSEKTEPIFSAEKWNKEISGTLEKGDMDEFQRVLEECGKALKSCKKDFIQEYLFENLTWISHMYNKDKEEKTSYKDIFEMDTYTEAVSKWQMYLKEIMENHCMLKDYSSEISEALKYIWKHYGERISVDQIAEELNLSTGYFSRMFKKQVGTSVVKYINQYRIQKAEELLSTTNMRVYEVADQVGISDYIYFSQVFKNLTGKSPSDFRK